MRPIDADALTEFLKCLLPARGMWEIEGDTAKDAICETVAEAIEMVKNMETIQPVVTDTNVGNNSETPNSSDCISRQAAIDALDCINGVEEVLRSLPSAQPEPQWIPCSEKMPKEELLDDGTLVVWTNTDMSKFSRVNVRQIGTHFGDLYYPDED